jgi:non-specific serine/threonine protein kinase/serine/threonine-protein kinase
MNPLNPGSPDDDLESLPPPQDMAGQRFGHYQIVREIGHGGMGTVYLAARADDEFQQQVALKILRGEFNPRDVLLRFRHERQILANLAHPNICKLLDGGSTPSGEPYLVMDYIDGIPVDQYCQTHALSIPQRIHLFRQVCSAVQYVHQNLIVHRDLKPGNILVTPDGSAKLLDFGIAKLLTPDQADVTRTAAQSMTLAYASPEQIRGDPITTASDVYSLGVILYELLTCRRPYRIDNPGAHALARAILQEEPDKPSTAVTQANPDTQQILRHPLKGDLDNILLQALRKEPHRRYSSVELFSEDLRRHLENLPVSAHQDSFGYRAAKFVRRHKVPVIAAAVAALSLVAGLITTIVEARIARSERALAESRFQDVRKLATTFLFDVHDAVQNLPGSTPARSLIARTGTQYLDRLAAQAQGDASLQQELATGYVKIGDVEGDPFNANLGDTAKAIESYRKAVALAEPLVSRNPRDRKSLQLLGLAQLHLAGVLPFANRSSEALEHSTQALKLYRRLLTLAPEDPEAMLDVGRAEEQQGDILGGMQSVNLGRKADAAAAYQRALDLIPPLPSGHPLAARATRGRVIITIKRATMRAGGENRFDIMDQYQKALQMAQDFARIDPNDRRSNELITYVLNKIAGLQQGFGDYQASLVTFAQASALDEEAMKADPNNSNARQNALGRYKNIGDVYFYSLGKWSDALASYRRAAELADIESRRDPNNVATRQRYSEVLTCIGSCLLRLNQLDEARRQSKLGLDMSRELADRPNATRDHLYNYAWLAVTVEPVDLEDPNRALPYILKVVAVDHGQNEYSQHVLAQTYAGLGRFEEAIAAEQKGLALFPDQPGAAKSDMQQTMEHMLKECQEQLQKQASKTSR